MSDSWITFGLLLSRAREQAGRSLMILDDADGEGCLWLGADAETTSARPRTNGFRFHSDEGRGHRVDHLV